MAGAMHKAMVYLGLAEEDDRYEAYDDEEDARDDRDRERAAARPARTGTHVEHVEGDEERTDRIERGEREHRAEVTHLPRRVPMSQVVSDVEVSGVNRITTIHPRTYNDAKSIGEAFREATPVIMNLTDLDDADAKRLVDFAAGLVFGLQGTIERVTNKVFLLSPAHVEVTSDDGEPTKNHKKLFNQS